MKIREFEWKAEMVGRWRHTWNDVVELTFGGNSAGGLDLLRDIESIAVFYERQLAWIVWA